MASRSSRWTRTSDERLNAGQPVGQVGPHGIEVGLAAPCGHRGIEAPSRCQAPRAHARQDTVRGRRCLPRRAASLPRGCVGLLRQGRASCAARAAVADSCHGQRRCIHPAGPVAHRPRTETGRPRWPAPPAGEAGGVPQSARAEAKPTIARLISSSTATYSGSPSGPRPRLQGLVVRRLGRRFQMAAHAVELGPRSERAGQLAVDAPGTRAAATASSA